VVSQQTFAAFTARKNYLVFFFLALQTFGCFNYSRDAHWAWTNYSLNLEVFLWKQVSLKNAKYSSHDQVPRWQLHQFQKNKTMLRLISELNTCKFAVCSHRKKGRYQRCSLVSRKSHLSKWVQWQPSVRPMSWRRRKKKCARGNCDLQWKLERPG